MTAQEEIFGPGGGASDSRCCARSMSWPSGWAAGRLGGDGLPGRRLARVTAAARAAAWEAIVARHGQLPAVQVAGTDLTPLIEEASPKAQAAGTYKGGFGFHPVRREALTIRAGVRDHRHRPVAAGR